MTVSVDDRDTNLRLIKDLDENSLAEARRAFKNQISPLISMRGPVYAMTVTDKRRLIDESRTNEMLLWPWGGRYWTTVFALSRADALRLLENDRVG